MNRVLVNFMFRPVFLMLLGALFCAQVLKAQTSDCSAAMPPPPAARQAQADIPDTPAGQKLKTWIENFNAADAARIVKFARENFSAKTQQESPAERCGEMDSRLHAMFGDVTVYFVETPAENAISAVLTNKGQTQWLGISFSVDPIAPHLMSDLNIGPTQSPVTTNKPLPAGQLTALLRSKVLETVIAGLAETYVDEKVGRTIGGVLQARLKAGAYDGLENPAQFAEAVTRDLRITNGDLHLSLRFSPAPATAARSRFDPFAGARQRNFGLGRAEILDGNVGYLEITGFDGVSGYEEATVDALRFLSRTDAMIIDLRRNPGGSGQMSHFLFSHFLGATPVPTITVRSRQTPQPAVQMSQADVPGPRRPDVPLYVLTSQATGSAAEEFSFVLKNLGRASIVGTRTAGAGHMVSFIPAGHGFILGVSITNVSDPKTGQQWEQVGVQPDIPVTAGQALAEAHTAALRFILNATSDPDRTRLLQRALDLAQARRDPKPIDAIHMARFAGTYDGRVVSVADGRVGFGRNAGALREDLIHLGNNRFALSANRLNFMERDGNLELAIEYPDGNTVILTRSDAVSPMKKRP